MPSWLGPDLLMLNRQCGVVSWVGSQSGLNQNSRVPAADWNSLVAPPWKLM